MAEFERDLLIERTNAGLRRAKAAGTLLGRPKSLSIEQRQYVERSLESGMPIAAIAREVRTSRQTVMRLRALLNVSVQPVSNSQAGSRVPGSEARGKDS